MKLFLKKVKYQNDLGICVFGKGRTDIQSKYIIIIVLYVNIFNMKLILREVVYVFLSTSYFSLQWNRNRQVVAMKNITT